MRAVYIPVGGRPSIVEVEDLSDLQRLVGGFIDAFPVFDPRGWTVYVNDDGIACSVPNRAVFADEAIEHEGYLSPVDGSAVRAGDLYTILWGDVVAIGFDSETGEDRDLTDAQAAEIIALFDGPECGPGSGQRELNRIARATRSNPGRVRP